MVIYGKVSSNNSAASMNMKSQIKHFKKLPNKKRLHTGTINVDISPNKFRVLKNDYIFTNVKWELGTEDFELIRIRKFGKRNERKAVFGYLYLPSGSPNRRDRFVLEVWTEWFNDMNMDDEVELEIPDGRLEIV